MFQLLSLKLNISKLAYIIFLHNNQVPLIIDTDSLLVQQVFYGNFEVPWLKAWYVSYIKSQMINKSVEICHLLKEANSLANSITYHIINFVGINRQQYYHLQEVSQKTKGIVQLQKVKIPDLWIIKIQNNNYLL